MTFEEQERAAYMAGDTDRADLLARVDDLDGMEDVIESRFNKEREVANEQSEFRRALIEDIELLCKRAKGARYKETKEFAASVIRAIEESYVEL